jgi:hypothetical protein
MWKNEDVPLRRVLGCTQLICGGGEGMRAGGISRYRSGDNTINPFLAMTERFCRQLTLHWVLSSLSCLVPSGSSVSPEASFGEQHRCGHLEDCFLA